MTLPLRLDAGVPPGVAAVTLPGTIEDASDLVRIDSAPLTARAEPAEGPSVPPAPRRPGYPADRPEVEWPGVLTR